MLAGWLAARRHRQPRWLQALELAGVAGALVVGLGLVELPNLEQLIRDAGTALGPWTYLLVGALAFAETGAFLGFVAPGETAVIAGGLVAGQGQISLLVLIGVVWVCAVLGDVTSFALGRRLGRGWLLRHGARLKVTEERLDQVEGFFERRGNVTILVGRFVGFVRPLLPFIAGASRMPLGRFLRYDVLAAGLWSATFSILGYVFWRSFDRLTTYVSRGLFALGTVVALAVAVVALVRLRRDPARRAALRRWLDERADRRGWRLVGRLAHLAAPGLMVGPLALELVTLLTLLAVGGFVFLLLGQVVLEHPRPGIDSWAFTVADPLRGSVSVHTARALTTLGSLWVIGPVTAATGAWALARGRRLDGAALLAGLVLSRLAVHVAKDAYDRPRPPGALVDTMLSAYPSGHAVQAVALVACATVLVRAGVRWAARVAAVGVAIALVALVAATRVFLRAHYLTDVLGGIALGVAVWSLVGALALVGAHAAARARARAS